MPTVRYKHLTLHWNQRTETPDSPCLYTNLTAKV